MRGQQNIFGDKEKESHHANGLNAGATMARQVAFAIWQRRLDGATVREIASQLNLKDQQVSSAISELHQWGKVRKTEARRDGLVVWIAVGEPK